MLRRFSWHFFFRDEIDDIVFSDGRAFDEQYHWHSLKPLSDDYDRSKQDFKGNSWSDKLFSYQGDSHTEMKSPFFLYRKVE